MVKGDERWLIDVSEEELEMLTTDKIRRLQQADKPYTTGRGGKMYFVRNAYYDPLEKGFHYIWDIIDENADGLIYETFELCKEAYERLTTVTTKWVLLGLTIHNKRVRKHISLNFVDEEKATKFMNWLNDNIYPRDFKKFEDFFKLE